MIDSLYGILERIVKIVSFLLIRKVGERSLLLSHLCERVRINCAFLTRLNDIFRGWILKSPVVARPIATGAGHVEGRRDRPTMTNPANPRRRPSVHITLQRAARLHVWCASWRPARPHSILSDCRRGCGRSTASSSFSSDVASRSATRPSCMTWYRRLPKLWAGCHFRIRS